MSREAEEQNAAKRLELKQEIRNIEEQFRLQSNSIQYRKQNGEKSTITLEKLSINEKIEKVINSPKGYECGGYK